MAGRVRALFREPGLHPLVRDPAGVAVGRRHLPGEPGQRGAVQPRARHRPRRPWPSASRSSCCRTRSSARSPASSSTGGAASGCCCSPTSSAPAIVVLAAGAADLAGPDQSGVLRHRAGGHQRQPVLPVGTVGRPAAHGLRNRGWCWPTRCPRPRARSRRSPAPASPCCCGTRSAAATTADAGAGLSPQPSSTCSARWWSAGSTPTRSGRTWTRSSPGRRCGTSWGSSGAASSPAAGTSGRVRRARNALLAIGAHRLFYGISTIATILLYRNYFTDHGVWRAGLPRPRRGVQRQRGRRAARARSLTPAVTARITKEAWIAAAAGRCGRRRAQRSALPYRQDLFVARRRCSSASSPRARRSASTPSSRRASTRSSSAGCSRCTTPCST